MKWLRRAMRLGARPENDWRRLSFVQPARLPVGKLQPSGGLIGEMSVLHFFENDWLVGDAIESADGNRVDRFSSVVHAVSAARQLVYRHEPRAHCGGRLFAARTHPVAAAGRPFPS